MIDTNTFNTLRVEFYVSEETLNIINQENLPVLPGDFNILDYKSKGIPAGDIVQIIQYVYGMSLYSAHELYRVVAENKKPIDIVPEILKKKTVTTTKEEGRGKREEGKKFLTLNLLPPLFFLLTSIS